MAPKAGKSAAKKPKKDKATKAPKATKPPKAQRSEPKRFNKVDAEQKALFLQHMPIIERLKATATSAAGKLRAAYKTAKAEGFTKKDFDDAFAMQTPEAEKAKKAELARTLMVARFMGADMGAKYDLFAEDERVAAVDRAYEEGQTASMQNKAAVPPYDPSTEQYRAYMKGFHDHQEKLAKGIKKASTEQAAVAANGDGKAPEPVQTDIGDVADKSEIDMPPPPGSPAAKEAAGQSSGIPVTRSEFTKRQADIASKAN